MISRAFMWSFWWYINSFWPSDIIRWHRYGSTLAQVMAWCLMAPSHYLNQCWLIVSTDQWRLSKCNFPRDTPAINHENRLQFAWIKVLSNLPKPMSWYWFDAVFSAIYPHPTHGQALGDLHRAVWSHQRSNYPTVVWAGRNGTHAQIWWEEMILVWKNVLTVKSLI